MVPQIKKILYTSDLSQNSRPALAWTMTLAHRYDAQITFLSVIEEISPSTAYSVRSFMGENRWKEMTEDQHNEANTEIQNRIGRFCEEVQNEMAACPMVVKDIVIKRGVPVEIILDEAESRRCDLIIMGTHGGGLFKDAMIGSTARRVLRRSKIPVLVVPLQEEDG